MTVKQRAGGEAHACNVKMRPLTVSCFPLNSVSLGTPELSKDPIGLLSIFREVSKRIETHSSTSVSEAACT